MGVGTGRPPLPTPTDISSADQDTPDIRSTVGLSDDLATEVSRVTDRTHWSIPEDGSPVTITTSNKRNKTGDPKAASNTSLLIEYYESASTQHPGRGPSVRVRVTPSSRRSSKNGKNHLKISETNRLGNPTLVRRIPIPGLGKDSIEQLNSPDQYARAPVEVDVNTSDISSISDGPTRLLVPQSDISSMPADSMLDGPAVFIEPKKRVSRTEIKREYEREEKPKTDTSRARTRDYNKEQAVILKAVEKIKRDYGLKSREPPKRRLSGSSDRNSRSRSVSHEYFEEGKTKSSKLRDESPDMHKYLNPSEISVVSSKSSNSGINNPKLLKMVEDAIKKSILPEVEALKEENHVLKNRARFDEITKQVKKSTTTQSSDDGKSVSKISSLPDVTSRERSQSISEDREYREEPRRKSSRRSSRESDRSHDTIRGGNSHRRSSRESRETRPRERDRERDRERETEKKSGLKGAFASGLGGAALGALVARGLQHRSPSTSTLDTSKDYHQRRSSRENVHSRTSSREHSRSKQSRRENTRDEIPPFPMGETMESDVTRNSLITDTDNDSARSRRSRRSVTPTQKVQSVSKGLANDKRSRDYYDHEFTDEDDDHNRLPTNVARESPKSSSNAKVGLAALGAAGAAGVAAAAHHHDKHNFTTPDRNESSLQNDRSRQEFAEHPRVRSIRSNNSMSSERRRKKSSSPSSGSGSPISQFRSKKRDGISLESPYEILPQEDEYGVEEEEEFNAWWEQEHEKNEQYRQINRLHGNQPGSQDQQRDTLYTDEDSLNAPLAINTVSGFQIISSNPHFVNTPEAAVSAVASLQDPSQISIHSSNKSNTRLSQSNSFSNTPLVNDDEFAAPIINNKRMETDSKQHWVSVRDRVMAMTDTHDQGVESPAHSEARSVDEKPVMHSNYVPTNEDMPNFSYNIRDDDEITNPSIISKPLGEGIEIPSYTGTPSSNLHDDDDYHHQSRGTGLLGLGAATIGLGLGSSAVKQGLNVGGNSNKENQQIGDMTHDIDSPSLSRDLNGPGYSSSLKDEGYMSANHGGVSPEPKSQLLRSLGDNNFDFDDVDDVDLQMDDPFSTKKGIQPKGGSGKNSNPFYDASSGKGIGQIESQDIVALMDHLTVRDAQRNARDTEILVTLVRSAAEMRNNFEDIKRFIADQDRAILNGVEKSVEKAAGPSGPRPFPAATNRNAGSNEAVEDVPTKRRNILKRALKGLSIKSSTDLTKIEDMLVQLLSEVEGLKVAQQSNPNLNPKNQNESIGSYDQLRSIPDTGYEPDGRTNTGSSPAQSGYLSNNSSRQNPAMHSGYDGGYRISTVMEDNEDVDDANEEEEEEVTTPKQIQRESTTPPTKEVTRSVPVETPRSRTDQFQENTPKTDKSRGKHKSVASSIFSAFPVISRWSKTTTSSVMDSGKKPRPYSMESYSGSNLELGHQYDDDGGVSIRRRKTRSASPLVPGDYGDEDDDGDYEGAKYRVHRNSTNLQHPQPRHGPTVRHQSHLEREAMDYENPPTPDADQWGSVPALALNKSRFSAASTAPRQSPIQSEDGYSDTSGDDGYHETYNQQNNGPLIPSSYNVPMVNSGMHIAKPLAPIEEVRHSLETDRNSIQLENTPSPRPTAMQNANRKITGPREMPNRNGSSGSRRLQAQQPPDSPVSYETYRTSLDGSETF